MAGDNGGMLDKRILHKKFYMELPGQVAVQLPAPSLPGGHSFQTFSQLEERLGREGAVEAWALIQTSVDAFENTAEGADYFEAVFLRHEEKAGAQVLFIVDDVGSPAATSAAWFAWDEDGNEIPILHWIATKPSAQGKGLGKAVVVEAIRVCVEVAGERPIMLSTQTGSHVAVRLYERLGFHMCKDKAFASDKLKSGVFSTYATPNEYEEGMEVLTQIFDADLIQRLEESAR